MSENIERERERQDYLRAKYSMKMAHYHLTDEVDKRCNVCDSGKIVMADGIRVCRVHMAFVTCGATCDLFKKRTESKEAEEE